MDPRLTNVKLFLKGDDRSGRQSLAIVIYNYANRIAARPPPDNRPPRTKTVSFADVTKAGADQAPGDVRIAPTRRQPIAASNYTNRRVLLRLKEGSSFFEKTSFQIRLALNEKLALTTQDIQDIKPTNTGWALVARNEEIQKKIIEQQTEWGPSIDLHTAEKQVTWYTYLIKDFPSELRSYDDSILDFDKTIGEEIVAQTGQTPVQWRRSNKPSLDPTTTTLIISFNQPIRGNFRLFGLGAYSFLLTKPKRLLQCQNCWLFHPPVRCTATKTCRTCGIMDKSHNTEDCQATPRCTNCHGPHAADDERCYARPRKTGETFHKLSKSQRIHARHLGTNDYRRQNMEDFVPSSSSPSAQENESTTISNNTEVDTEMADTPSHDTAPEQAEDPLPAVGDEDVDDTMGDIVEEPPHINSGVNDEASGVEGFKGTAARTEQSEAQVEASKENEVAGVHGERIMEDEATDDETDDRTKDIDETEEEAEEEGNNDDVDREDDILVGDEMGSNHHARHYNEHIDQQHPQPRSSGRATTTRVQTSTQRNNTTRGRTAQPTTAVKKRFLTYSARRKVIPSDDPSPSSDGPTAEQIIARPLQRRSPPSSPPQEARLTIKIFQANVDKCGESHSAALQLAFLEGFNVVILQEPNTSYNKQKQLCRTQHHPGFICFSPVDSWFNNDTRPRVMTYVKIDNQLQAEQITPTRHRDLVWVKVNGITILNVYNRPEVEETLSILENWTPTRNCIVAGDMNAYHVSWQSVRRASQSGNRLHKWTEENNLRLLNEPDEPTTIAKRNSRSSTIDLAFSNIPEASATVEVHLTTGSLHHTIGIEVPNREPAPRILGKVRVTTPDEIKAFGEHVEKAVQSLPKILESEAQIEDMAEELQNILQNSAQACGKVSKGRCARSCPWWNQECIDAYEDLRITRRLYENQRGEDVQRARVRFRRIIKRTRQKFWRSVVNDVTAPNDVFKLTKWMKPTQRLQPPPIQVGDKLYSTDMDRALALRKEKLERRDASDDIHDPWQPAVHPPRKIPLEGTISTKEIEKAVLQTGNTTPGADGITTKMLQAAWPHIAQALTTLYNACLRIGYHPTVFKTAEVVMIPKPNKRDLSDNGLSQNEWHTLPSDTALPTLTRLEHSRNGPPQTLLHPWVYDLEKALSSGKAATLVTEDVMGAFDAILRNRTILRLRQQGWPNFLIRWVASFLLDRMVKVRFQDATTPSARLQCGLPQGSPISPILYILVTAAIYYLPGAAQRYGYADDTAMLFIGGSLEDTARQANEAIAAMESWGRDEAIHFDPAKTEIMHFSRRTADQGQSPAVDHGGKELRASRSMRWLGVWLDRGLTFNEHIQKWTHKARAVVNHLRIMNNTVRGMAAAAARRAVWAVAMPILFHGLDVWLPGLDKDGSRFRRDHISKGNLDKIQKVLNLACKMILPTWKTTPLEFLWKEAAIPPASVLLRHFQERIAVRHATLDNAHPISKRLRQSQREIELSEKPLVAERVALRESRLLRTASRTTKIERPRLIPHRFSDVIQVDGPRERHAKDRAVIKFEHWLAGRPAGYVVFSDGSKTDKDTTGYGFAVFHHGQLLDWGSGQLGRREVFDAEIHGALAGLNAAMQRNSRLEPITVCMDNTSVIDCIGATAAVSSQACFREFQKIGDKHPYLISVKWSPGHTGIFGNELADQLAKHGATLPTNEHLPSVSYRRRRTKRQVATDYQAWWASVERTEYLKLGLRADLKKLPELSLPRRQLGYLLTARTQHGDFAEYHERFHPGQATLECPCGRLKSPTHLFYCRKIPGHLRVRLTPDPEMAIGKFLGRSYQVYVRIADFYYSKINKRM
ncbi:hypothetical protein NLG97_g581 [Lecanicillium saksenae]|uniref:Uncharacterized protein n=1 Tax=Lecanicillium saksenae TaxID=468837 RepID=A0ACC1R8S7_9HYPO|nr:hypothetical protein NLG97_g581 [Lecanicillium saksenae]